MPGARRCETLLFALVLACALTGPLAPRSARASDDPLGVGSGAIFRLGPESRYQEGCFAPCMCPIMEQREVRGTFELRAVADDDGIQRYAVDDVNWTVGREEPLRIIGAGSYSIGSPDGLPEVQHRLELDLVVDDRQPQHFDSGWVPLTEDGRISIAVSINGMYCWDTALAIEASRVPDEEIYHYALVPGSSFQRGCFDPCACPISAELPLRGSFTIVTLTESIMVREFAVVDVRWEVLSNSTPSRIPITGFGVYQMLGDFVLQQRLTLDLVVGAEPRAHFDTGAVIPSGGHEIDLVASLNGRRCFDTVLHVIADEANGVVCGGIAGLGCAQGEFCKFPAGQCCCDQLGTCAPVPDACPTVFDPVCGCDGLTYGNECESDMAGVSVAHRGACGDACFSDANCASGDDYCRYEDGMCGAAGTPGECVPVAGGVPDVWDPVCGCDGLTYTNELAADAAGVATRRSGACPPPPPPPPRPSAQRLAPTRQISGDPRRKPED